MKKYQVKQGDCISSIAEENGFFWETLWNLPENERIRELRKDPNLLYPGDIIFVPNINIKEVSEPTNQVHKFQVRNSPAKLKLRILKNGEPRAGESFVLIINDEEKDSGTIPSDGNIRISIPPTAKKGELIIGQGENQEIYKLNLGYLDPIDKITGVQARLHNLGFDCGKINGKIDEQTTKALKSFQNYINHPNPTGELDSQTLEALEKLHDNTL